MNEIEIIEGDCLEKVKDIIDSSIDLIITDPPYSTPVITSFGRKKINNLADLRMQEFFFNTLRKEFERVLKTNGRVFIFCDDKYYPILFSVFYEWQNKSLVIWDKGRINMGQPFRKRHELIFYACRESFEPKDRGIPSILQYRPENDVFASQKPLQLIKDLIVNFTEEGDRVFDPFVGSGTTLLACKILKRRCTGIELNPETVKIAKRRLVECLM
jgi:site-specific DNA-methyltransferase (adenine-specific)